MTRTWESQIKISTVGLSALIYSPHVSRSPVGGSSGTQGTPSGHGLLPQQPENTHVPALLPTASLEGAVIWRDTAPTGGGQLQGWAGRSHGVRARLWGWDDLGSRKYFEFFAQFFLNLWLFLIGEVGPQPSMTHNGASWENLRIIDMFGS